MGMAELYMRVVHHRDADIQAMATVTPDQAVHYQYPPQVGNTALQTQKAVNAHL